MIQNKQTDWNERLCEHYPDEKVWVNIAMRLDFEDKIAEHLNNLPAYQPEIDTWSKISKKINKRISFENRTMIFAVAASVAVIFFISTLLIQTIITDNVHTQETTLTTLTEVDMEQVAMQKIKNHCSIHMPVCEQSNFKELLELYYELKAEELQLKLAMKQLGDSPEMIQAMVKIVNLKSTTIQDLIMLLQS